MVNFWSKCQGARCRPFGSKGCIEVGTSTRPLRSFGSLGIRLGLMMLLLLFVLKGPNLFQFFLVVASVGHLASKFSSTALSAYFRIDLSPF